MLQHCNVLHCAYESSLGCNLFHEGPQTGQQGESLAPADYEKHFAEVIEMHTITKHCGSNELYISYISHTACYIVACMVHCLVTNHCRIEEWMAKARVMPWSLVSHPQSTVCGEEEDEEYLFFLRQELFMFRHTVICSWRRLLSIFTQT